jgi:hypothetical protein
MNAYAQWGQFKSFNICGATEEDRLYLVEVHTGYSASGPLGRRPGVLLHNGTSKKDPILAAAGDESQFAARAYSFNNESIILMPPLRGSTAAQTGDFVTERMRASVSSGQVTFDFDIEVGSGDKLRQERFQWRKIKKGTDGSAKEGGFTLVAANSGAPSTPSSSSSTNADGHVVALLMWRKLFPTFKHAFTLELFGRGLSGELGERWRLMVVMTALRLWTIRVKGKTTKGLIAMGEKMSTK